MTKKTNTAFRVTGMLCVILAIVLFVVLNFFIKSAHDDVLSGHSNSHADPNSHTTMHELKAREYNVAKRGAILSGTFFGIGLACLVASASSDRKNKQSQPSL